MHVPARACSDLLSPLVKDGSRRLGRAWDGTLGRWAEWPSLALGGGGRGDGGRCTEGGVRGLAARSADSRERAHARESASCGGWRAPELQTGGVAGDEARGGGHAVRPARAGLGA